MEIKFIKAKKQDEKQINQLFIEMIQTIHNTPNPQGFKKGYLEKFFTEKEDWICVATDKDKIVAFLSIEVYREDKNYVYLSDLCVTKEYRNNKIATRLLDVANEYAKSINIDVICLHVEKANFTAFRLYDSLGYKIYKELENKYLMIKRI
jgi:ribosomal protein S18 acetylase RimI-like enzyme